MHNDGHFARRELMANGMSPKIRSAGDPSLSLKPLTPWDLALDHSNATRLSGCTCLRAHLRILKNFASGHYATCLRVR